LKADFEAFWRAYPNRVGKLAAEKAYVKARKTASAAELLSGIARYLLNKPAYADFCHPATWLNQGRWLDEALEKPRSARSDGGMRCPHTPTCQRFKDCTEKILREARAS